MHDDSFHEQALTELRQKTIVTAVWGRAVAESGGDKNKAVSCYVALRAAQLSRLGKKMAGAPQDRSNLITAAGGETIAALSSAPPAIPFSSAKDEISQMQIWSRFGAKIIDLILYAIPTFLLLPFVTLLLVILIGDKTLPPEKMSNAWMLTSTLLITFFFFPAAFLFLSHFIDAIILHLTGTSPGRKLMRIQIDFPVGTPFRTKLKRNFGCFIKGFCAGAQPLMFISLLYQGLIVTTGKQTSWDRNNRCTVSYGKPSLLGWAVLALLITAVYFFSAMADERKNARQQETTYSSSSSPLYETPSSASQPRSAHDPENSSAASAQDKSSTGPTYEPPEQHDSLSIEDEMEQKLAQAARNALSRYPYLDEPLWAQTVVLWRDAYMTHYQASPDKALEAAADAVEFYKSHRNERCEPDELLSTYDTEGQLKLGVRCHPY